MEDSFWHGSQNAECFFSLGTLPAFATLKISTIVAVPLLHYVKTARRKHRQIFRLSCIVPLITRGVWLQCVLVPHVHRRNEKNSGDWLGSLAPLSPPPSPFFTICMDGKPETPPETHLWTIRGCKTLHHSGGECVFGDTATFFLCELSGRDSYSHEEGHNSSPDGWTGRHLSSGHICHSTEEECVLIFYFSLLKWVTKEGKGARDIFIGSTARLVMNFYRNMALAHFSTLFSCTRMEKRHANVQRAKERTRRKKEKNGERCSRAGHTPAPVRRSGTKISPFTFTSITAARCNPLFPSRSCLGIEQWVRRASECIFTLRSSRKIDNSQFPMASVVGRFYLLVPYTSTSFSLSCSDFEIFQLVFAYDQKCFG